MTTETMSDRATLPDGTPCRGKLHTSSNTAWRNGCRHPGAIEAHAQWLARNGGDRDRMMPPAVDADGNCIAEKHHSTRAYRRGCRCAKAIEVWEASQQRRRDPDRVRRGVAAASQWAREAQQAKRRTGGRLSHDPRRQWRGGVMVVNRVNLMLLLSGFVDSPTRGEKLAAVARLRSTLTRDGWYEAPRPLMNSEIAARIGTTDQTVGRMIGMQQELAGNRALRRLADAQWKAAIVAAAVERGR